MRQWQGMLVVGVVWALVSHAQTNAPGRPMPMPAAPKTPSGAGPGAVQGFMVPEYDANGQMVWRMFGDRARLELMGGRVEVEQMKLELFRDGQVDATMRSAVCLFDRAAKTANSEKAVEIVATNMVVTGRGFDWSAADSRMRIHSDVTVTLFGRKGMMISMPGAKQQP